MVAYVVRFSCVHRPRFIVSLLWLFFLVLIRLLSTSKQIGWEEPNSVSEMTYFMSSWTLNLNPINQLLLRCNIIVTFCLGTALIAYRDVLDT